MRTQGEVDGFELWLASIEPVLDEKGRALVREARSMIGLAATALGPHASVEAILACLSGCIYVEPEHLGKRVLH
jgi:hypothetical protein